jgi:hypothetical protein
LSEQDKDDIAMRVIEFIGQLAAQFKREDAA